MIMPAKIEKLILGTVQLGLNYGPNKDNYEVSATRAMDILSKAFDLGITTLDTATGYGKSHQFISEFHRQFPRRIFNIITKITGSDLQKNPNIVENLIKDFGVNHLDGILLHSVDDIYNFELLNYLTAQKQQSRVQKIGFSAYYSESFESQVSSSAFDFVQIPLNVLDNRKLREKEFRVLKNSKLEVHTRSTFLRGAFFYQHQKEIPEQLKPCILRLNNISKRHNIDLKALCLNYCLQAPDVSKVVIGVDSVEELQENAELTNTFISEEIMQEIETIQIENFQFLDLRNW